MRNKVIVLLVTFIALFIFAYLKDLYSYKEKYEIGLSNFKTLYYNNDSIKNHNRVLQYTIDELEYSNDSITLTLDSIRKELKIKDSKLKALYALKSTIIKTDTILLRDTIIKENAKVDTIIGDNWYSNHLIISYPNTIITTPSFRSEKYIVVNTKRETVKKPSPIFFIRWFQKKHTVVEVNVVEKNPYITEQENRFIEIVR